MADQNIGRAWGQIEITSDTRGATEAQAAMAATAAESETLNRSMGRVNEQFKENQKTNVLTAEQLRKQREQVEELRKTYERHFADYERASRKYREAKEAEKRIETDSEATAKQIEKVSRDVTNAHELHARALGRLDDSYAKYQTRLQSVHAAVERFNAAHIAATSNIAKMRFEAERAGEALESLSAKLSSVLRTVGSGGIMGIFGLSSAGTTSAMGAAGLSGLTNIASGAYESITQLSGVIALLPAIVNTAALSLGTLAVSFQGIGNALGSMNDPNKFIESLKEISPVAREAMVQIYQFSDAMRGARQMVQDSFFAPMVADIQPLIRTWLPELMRAGQAIGNQFGQMGHEIARVFMTPEMQASFSSFVQNMTTGMQNLRGAIQPVLHAWMELSNVGGTFLPQIGSAITELANKFNAWVSAAANDGRLAHWINQALTGFTNLGNIVLNVAEAVGNIMSIGDKFGGGFLEYMRQLSVEFKNWTESARGQQTIANFFDLIHQAGQAMTPILKLIGEGIATVAGAFTRLGIQIAPAVASFFKDIVDSLHLLAPIIQQAGPSISAFLVELGHTLATVVQQAGPELPKLFKGMSDALITLLPILPQVVALVAGLLDHLSPDSIKGIFLATIALAALSKALGIMALALDANPITLVIGALALLGVAVYELYQKWQPFHDAVDGLWQLLKSLAAWVANAFSESGVLAPLASLADKAYNWGKNLVTKFIDGMGSVLSDVGKMAHNLADEVDKSWHPGSPTREGPLSQDGGTERWGAKLVENYAAGMSGSSGAVSSAASGIAGSASGITGTSFSSAGRGGRSGEQGSGIGQSGFSQYIDFLTKDLQSWQSIFSKSFDLVQLATSQVVQGIRVVASIWGHGDNPLTRAGGIAGPPVIANQWGVAGVPNAQAPGKAPIPELAKLGGPPASQQTIPGVPNVKSPQSPGGDQQPGSLTPTPAGPPSPPAPPGPGSAGGAPPGPTVTGAAGPPGGAPPGALGPNSSKQDIANYIISTALSKGYTREQANAFAVQATGESALQADIVSPASAGDASGAAVGIFQFVPGTARGIGLQDPKNAQQNIDAYFRLAEQAGGPAAFTAQGPGQFLGVNVSGGGPWHPANQRRGDLDAARQNAQGYINNYAAPANTAGWAGRTAAPIGGQGFAEELARRRAGQPATQAGAVAPAGGVGLPQAAGRWPSGPGGDVGVASLQAAGFPPLFQNPAGGGNPTIPQWVQDFVKQYGGPSLVAGSTPHGSLHGNSGGAGYAVDVTGDPAEQDKLAKFLEEHPEASAMMIHQDVGGEPRGVLAGQAVAKGTVFTSPGGTYADESTMVHWAPSGGGNAPPTIAPSPATSVGAVGPGIPPPPSGTDAPNLGDISNQYDDLPEYAKDAIIDTLVGTGLFASGAIARRVFGSRSRTGTPSAGQPNIRRPFEGQLPSGVDYTTREALARAGGYGVRSGTTTFEGAQTYRLGPFERRTTQPSMSQFEARTRLGIPDPGTGGLRYGAFNEGLGPLQGPEVGPYFQRAPIASTWDPLEYLQRFNRFPVTGVPPGNPAASVTGAPIDVADYPPFPEGAGPQVAAKPPGVNLSRNPAYTGHNIPLDPKNFYRAINVPGFDPRDGLASLFGDEGVMRGFGRGGSDRLSFQGGFPNDLYTNGPFTTSNLILEGDASMGVEAAKGASGYGYVDELKLADVLSGKTPMRLWQRTAPEGTSIGQVHQWQPVFDSFQPPEGQVGAADAGTGGWRYPAISGQTPEPGAPTFRAPPTGGVSPGLPTGGFRFGLGTVLGLGMVGAQPDVMTTDTRGSIPGQQTWQQRLGITPELLASQSGAGLLGQLLLGGAPTGQANLDTTPFNPGPRRPPAQVQGQVPPTPAQAPAPPPRPAPTPPSNAGQFRGVDPNQLVGPIAPGGPGPTRGLTGTDRLSQELINRRAAEGVDTRTGAGKPIPVDVTHQGGVPVPKPSVTPSPTPAIQPSQPARPTQPSPAPGPVNPPAQVQGQQPATGVGQFAGGDKSTLPDQNAPATGIGAPQKLPFNAQSPLEAFTSGMSAAGSIAGDAFKVFGDIINNIKATADFTEMLARGPSTSEDIVGMIQNLQTYLTTAADVAHLVGDIGSMVGGASGGMDMGGGAALSAISGLVSSAFQGVNDAITLGIDVYHQVGKYAGFIFGSMLGGPNTGPLGGNVRMILNTRTNQLMTFSDENPLNKNVFNVPGWQRTYNQQPTPAALPAQVNIYTGPGQTPAGMMQEAMWNSNVGAGAVASVAGRD